MSILVKLFPKKGVTDPFFADSPWAKGSTFGAVLIDTATDDPNEAVEVVRKGYGKDFLKSYDIQFFSGSLTGAREEK